MNDLLFHRYNIFDIIESRKLDLKEEINRIPAEALNDDIHALAKQVATKYVLSVPVLHEDKQYKAQREMQIDATGDRMMQFNMGYPDGPIYVNVSEVTVSIPFEGDPDLLQARPATFSLNPPRGYVADHVLNLVFKVRQGGPSLKEQYDGALRGVRDHLRWLSDSVARVREKLEQEALPALMRRKLDVEARAASVSTLGIPMRNREIAGESRLTPPARRTIEPNSVVEKWDAFISHASEDKEEIARPLATALQAMGLEVWYDEFSLKLGDSLRESIDRGLAHSTFGIVILSKHFFEKNWPTKELNGLVAREADGKKVILPVWHHISEPEVREYSPILADRFAVSTDRPLEAVVAQIVEAILATKKS